MPWPLSRAIAAGAFVSFLAAGCTSVDTSLVAPAPGPKCQLSAGGTPVSFGPGGGSGTMNITTTRDCTWAITGMPAWISIAGERGGQGEAAIAFTVDSNPVPVPRNGSITVGSEAVQISQDPAPCRFALNQSEQSIGAAGGSITVQVDTLSGCTWSVASDVPWVGISSGSSGNASGTVGLAVSVNAGAARSGIVRIAGEAFTVRQSAAGTQTPVPTPPSQTPPSQTPPAPAPKPVQYEGTTRDVKGNCPNLTFTVAGHRIETSSRTTFAGGSCRDLEKDDRRVRVNGTERSNGTVDATQVTRIGS